MDAPFSAFSEDSSTPPFYLELPSLSSSSADTAKTGEQSDNNNTSSLFASILEELRLSPVSAQGITLSETPQTNLPELMSPNISADLSSWLTPSDDAGSAAMESPSLTPSEEIDSWLQPSDEDPMESSASGHHLDLPLWKGTSPPSIKLTARNDTANSVEQHCCSAVCISSATTEALTKVNSTHSSAAGTDEGDKSPCHTDESHFGDNSDRMVNGSSGFSPEKVPDGPENRQQPPVKSVSTNVEEDTPDSDPKEDFVSDCNTSDTSENSSLSGGPDKYNGSFYGSFEDTGFGEESMVGDLSGLICGLDEAGLGTGEGSRCPDYCHIFTQLFSRCAWLLPGCMKCDDMADDADRCCSKVERCLDKTDECFYSIELTGTKWYKQCARNGHT